jgi:transcriptional regulator with XRE-family HTH domain
MPNRRAPKNESRHFLEASHRRISACSQKQIKARAGELIAEELALRDIRKSPALTQEQVAKRLGGKQVYVSRIESHSDVKVSTLRDYVHALGWELQWMVTFPGGDDGESKECIFASIAKVFALNKTCRVPPAIENIGNMNVLADYSVKNECLAFKHQVPQPVTKVWSCNANKWKILKIINATENAVDEFFGKQR